jgi:polysaccharide deacetylase 2 family uncharacterized protein YibQ
VLGLAMLAAAVLVLRPRSLPPPPLAPPRFVPRASPAPPRRAEVREPTRPRVAIVIDDLGDSLEVAHTVLALRPPVTVAVMPMRAASGTVAAAAVERGSEVILHLPLEPEGRGAMAGGAGFLEVGMTPPRMEGQLTADLAAVPYIVGVNGHMGSRFTRDPAMMEALLAALRARGLFFVDSVTSGDSVAAATAARLGVPFARRSVFLDHDREPAAIARQLDRLLAVAERDGEAVAIGHPHAATIAALGRWLPAAERRGIAFVPVSALVR